MGLKKAVSRTLALVAIGLGALAFAGPPPAAAGIGIMDLTRSAGAPGDRVTLTLGCGACYPPCKKGADGRYHPEGYDRGTCMMGVKGEPPPESFGVSLVPVKEAPRQARVKAPPRRPPFTFLGLAAPPPGGNDPARGTPRYLLRFEVPERRPGIYAFAIYCDFCLRGEGGSLLVSSGDRDGRFRVRPDEPAATIAPWLVGLLGW
jgi:hypothetical protein